MPTTRVVRRVPGGRAVDPVTVVGSTARAVQVVLPGNVDDPATPSGGNTYDRQLCRGLAAAGWVVRESAVAGGWPYPTTAERARLAALLAALEDDTIVLLDGLVASAVPDVIGPAARRLRLIVLVHMPLRHDTGLTPDAAAILDAAERQSLRAAAAVIATSDSTRRELVDHHGLADDRAYVATPGVEPAPPAAGTGHGGELLCVAAVTVHKGQDLLVAALATLADRPFHCRFVGALGRDPQYVDRVRRLVRSAGLTGRVALTGPRTGADLAAAYAGADLVVLPSRSETYGMVLTEALARGIPVLATAVGGVPEALGTTPGGQRPGLLVPAADPTALADALRCWLDQPDLRRQLRQAANERRATLRGWQTTTRAVADVLERLRREPGRAP